MENKPKLYSRKQTYVQPQDGGGWYESDLQKIEIETDDQGGGPYAIIKGEWSTDSPEELAELIRQTLDGVEGFDER